MSTVGLDIVIDIDSHARDPEKSNFDQQMVGNIEIMEDRVYITAGKTCLGFDRYIINELLKREAKA